MSKDPSGSAAINYTVETPKVHTFMFIFISIEFFRSKIFRREIFRPHIPIPNFLKIPKITLRKLCDEAWCPKTKYIIQNHEFIVNCSGLTHRKNKCLCITYANSHLSPATAAGEAHAQQGLHGVAHRGCVGHTS